MATSIRIGQGEVPVVEHIDITGQPSRHPNAAAQVMLSKTNDIWWALGETYGSASNPARPSGPGSNTIVHGGGRTALHDSTEIIFSIYDGTETYVPGVYSDFVISRQEGETAVSLDGTQNLTIAVGFSASTASAYNRDGNLLAVEYAFPEASTEEGRRNGYMIFCVEKELIYTAAGVYAGTNYNRRSQVVYIDIPYLNTYYDLDLIYEETPGPDEPPFDPSEPEDYNPTIDDTSDTVPIPSNPLIGVSNAGLHHVYNPSVGGLQNFGAWLFPNPELPSTADPTAIVEYLLLLCQTLANARLIDYVLDCHIIPVTPQTGASQDIKVGGRTATGISAPVVTNDYIDATCGSLNIREYFGGYQDYLYTKSKLFLPFVGFVDVIPEFWQSGTISVDYKFNVIDGSFMCYIRSVSSKSQLNGSVIAQYSGSACIHLPISGINYASMVSGLVGAASGVEGAKSASQVLGGAYSAANTVLQGGDMKQSNSYTGSANMMSIRYPFLMIERPVPSMPSTYMHSKGYPANIAALLSGVTGFTIIEDIDLSGIPLTDGEITELRSLLAEGVYL